ncbi:MAG TPA: right-handed parallel beta-helix repeat-containing protein [Candidatus Tectomicrobia bacterium]
MTHARAGVGIVVFASLIALVLLGRQEQSLGVASADSTVKKVKCDEGQTLTDALKTAKPGDTLQVTGTCHERVTITIDRLTLDGGGSAVLDGGGGSPMEFEGVVTIDGAHGVTLTGFTVQNGPGEGILGLHGAAFAVQQAAVKNNATSGIAVADGSTADLTDCTMQGNGFGMDVFTSSSAILRGAITSSHNTGNGAEVNGQSILEIRGAQVQMNDNGGIGLVAGSGQVAIFGFTAAQGSTLTANRNGGWGIIISGSQLTILGSDFGSGANIITAANNGADGILVSDGVIASPFGTGKFVLENNVSAGLNLINGAGTNITGGLSVRNNGTGVLADGAGTLTLVSIPSNPSSIENNSGTDVDLKFGTRATFDGVTIGSIACDATVLSRGSTVCP